MTIATMVAALASPKTGLSGSSVAAAIAPHSLKANSPGTPRPNWGYNSNPDAPTFTPSVVQRLTKSERATLMSGETVELRPFICHSFVTDGRIQYLDDCAHVLAGQTIELPDWEATWKTW